MDAIPFGEYTPDLPDYKNAGATIANNCVPHGKSYKQLLDLGTYSGVIDSQALGAISVNDTSGNAYTYVGDAGKLYRLLGTVWTDASKSGGYAISSEGSWAFTRINEKLIASSLSAPLQSMTIGGLNFADHVVSTRKPSFKALGVVRAFLVGVNATDSVDGAKERRAWWSSITDDTDFDPDSATQSGYQDLQGVDGQAQAIVSGEYGLIFLEHSVYRMTYEGGDTIFRFDQILKNRGAFAAKGVVSFDRRTYFLHNEGFFVTDGTTAVPIGQNRVDRTFFNDLDPAYDHRITASIDPDNSLVMWSYPSSGNAGVPDRLLIYNWESDRWSTADVTLDYLFLARKQGLHMDEDDPSDANDSDMDAGSPSLDSSIYGGGQPQLAAMRTDFKLGYFDSTALAAVIETGEIQPFPGHRTVLTNTRPLVDGTTATTTVQVGVRDLQTAAHSWGTAVSLNTIGEANIRKDARYMRFRENISGGFDHAQGIEIAARRGGKR